uniref:Uncharacterized protein n=1 Tax=Arion vulgaris TaxID=1028688 RepID=A0A0B6YTK2_9EUPU
MTLNRSSSSSHLIRHAERVVQGIIVAVLEIDLLLDDDTKVDNTVVYIGGSV